MRPIARQSTRLAASGRARHSSGSRQSISQPQRPFTTTVQRQSEPRAPSGPSDHHTSLNDRKETAHIRESEPRKRNHEAESENGESKPSRASEAENGETKTTADTKSTLRLNARRKRVNDVPKPPPVPQWFLDQNVRLIEDTTGLDVGKGGRWRAIRCVDAETGHTLLTVPYKFGFDNSLPLKALLKTATRRDAPESRNVAKIWYACQSKESKEKASLLNDQAKRDHHSEDIHKTWESQFPAVGGNSKVEYPFDRRLESPEQLEASNQALSRHDHYFVPGSDGHIHRMEWHMDPMAWSFLEAETSVRAALSLANEERRSSSFAADRVDVSLQCPDANSHDQLDDFVSNLAGVVHADLIRLDANDFAELSEDYVSQGHDAPGSFSNLGYDVFDGFVASGLRSRSTPSLQQVDAEKRNDMDEDEEDDADDHNTAPQFGSPLAAFIDLRMGHVSELEKKLNEFRTRRIESPRSSDMNRDDARVDALLEGLLDATTEKRSTSNYTQAKQRDQDQYPSTDRTAYTTSELCRMHPFIWRSQTAWLTASHLHRLERVNNEETPHKLVLETEHYDGDSNAARQGERKIIVHVRDLRDICNSRLGESVVKRLVKIVQKRRRNGERIVIVGTTAQDVPGPFRLPGDHSDDFPFRTLSVPPLFSLKSPHDRQAFKSNSPSLPQDTLDRPAYQRILEINLRHLQTMLRRISAKNNVNLYSSKARTQLNLNGMHFLSERVLSLDEIQRLSLTAIGFSQSYAEADELCPLHVVLAALVIARNDHVMQHYPAFKERKEEVTVKAQNADHQGKRSSEEISQARMDNLRKNCNPHETRLLSGVVDPQNINTRFVDVHAPVETIDALKTLTSLSLLRPDAFKYGVLANDRLPGLLLYGPPGTGKTLLAKAVAKESRATVLEVSGAQIYEKYVGEGEKMVRAVFSLAKKLSPCVVFIDEADSMFGSRSNQGNRNTHREIINQFLREWDGMDDHGVFMMVATNRPFDLDDAVLRRLPRRLLIDLPVTKDRESILGIHLRNENLDPSVSLSELAEQTPLYSGSDLKNLSVAAALACVREENELAELRKEDTEFKLPEQRTLTSQHFEKALTEISASISEDMSTLAAIRKFDEQYGDRKGRRKKTSYGFGALDAVVDESAARVRQSSPPPP